MFKNALISVSDKAGLIEFLAPYVKSGMRIVSTGGTAQHLKAAGYSVIDISEQTKFPEVMGGRVKTLHPNVHMALLSRPGVAEDSELLKKFDLEAFDLLICNLYPFEQSVLDGVTGDALVEKIDIGGPSMLRGAAKNFARMTVLCDPKDYKWVSEKDKIELQDRKQLAAKVFAHTAAYDSLVSQKLGAGFSEEFTRAGREHARLRYGENPDQQAKWYRNLANNSGLHSAEVLQGKELSYNNILDLDAASMLVADFESPSCVAVKHNNPCGVASDETLPIAVEKALKADPISVFGGIIAVNRELDADSAKLLSEIFLECIVAPSFSEGALSILKAKKNLRLLRWASMMEASRKFDFRNVSGGFLMQDRDQLGSNPADWRFLGEQPSSSVLKDLVFAEKVCASLKSNSIALVQGLQTRGLGMGQVNRVEAVRHSIERAQLHHPKTTDLILASDAFFPFADSIQLAAEAGVRWVLQPGGSVKDEEVQAMAKKLKINMILTGKRHFRH